MDTLLFSMRALHFAATISASGVVIFRQAVVASSFADPSFERVLRRIVASSIVILVASGLGWFAVTTAVIAEQPIEDIFTGPLAGEVLLETQFGQVSLLRLAIAIALSVCAATCRDRWVSVTLATILLATLAWLGHSGAAPNIFYTAADALHVTAAGVWLGGLVPLALLLAALRYQKDAQSVSIARVVTQRFSTLGVAMVAAILLTGLINTWNLAGSLEDIFDTLYGHLLLVKIALFAAMVAVAAINRYRLTPRLELPRAMQQLQRNALIEAMLGALIIAIVAALGMISPGSHGAMHHLH